MAAILTVLIVFLLIAASADAQCAMCTKTAMQLGEKPALGLNNGILYLMISPFAIVGFIAFRWWRGQQAEEAAADDISSTA